MEDNLVYYFLPKWPKFPVSEVLQNFGKHKLSLIKLFLF